MQRTAQTNISRKQNKQTNNYVYKLSFCGHNFKTYGDVSISPHDLKIIFIEKPHDFKIIFIEKGNFYSTDLLEEIMGMGRKSIIKN